MINRQIIEQMNPCTDRFNNFLKHYPNFNGAVEDFVMLENISYSDKIWVLVRLMSHQQKRVFALKCASSVLDVFEQKYPNDDRPRKALEAAEAYLANATKENAAVAAAAAYAASAAAAAVAADAAAAAYAYAAYAAADAVVAYAVYAADAADAAYAYAAYADAVKIEQGELNLIFAVETLKGE